MPRPIIEVTVIVPMRGEEMLAGHVVEALLDRRHMPDDLVAGVVAVRVEADGTQTVLCVANMSRAPQSAELLAKVDDAVRQDLFFDLVE